MEKTKVSWKIFLGMAALCSAGLPALPETGNFSINRTLPGLADKNQQPLEHRAMRPYRYRFFPIQ